MLHSFQNPALTPLSEARQVMLNLSGGTRVEIRQVTGPESGESLNNKARMCEGPEAVRPTYGILLVRSGE